VDGARDGSAERKESKQEVKKKPSKEGFLLPEIYGQSGIIVFPHQEDTKKCH
jgi:hypothetical protein